MPPGVRLCPQESTRTEYCGLGSCFRSYNYCALNRTHLLSSPMNKTAHLALTNQHPLTTVCPRYTTTEVVASLKPYHVHVISVHSIQLIQLTSEESKNINEVPSPATSVRQANMKGHDASLSTTRYTLRWPLSPPHNRSSLERKAAPAYQEQSAFS